MTLPSRLGGALSPQLGMARPGSASPVRYKFPTESLRPYIKTILAQTLSGVAWDGNDKVKMGSISKSISEKVKKRMMEVEPKGFKYIVTTTLSENLGQAGRADMTAHWEETDVAIQEMYSNDSIIFVCVAFAVRVI